MARCAVFSAPGSSDQPIVRVLAGAVKRNCTRCTPTERSRCDDLGGDAVARGAHAESSPAAAAPARQRISTDRLRRSGSPPPIRNAAGPPAHRLWLRATISRRASSATEQRRCHAPVAEPLALAHQRQSQIDLVLARPMQAPRAFVARPHRQRRALSCSARVLQANRSSESFHVVCRGMMQPLSGGSAIRPPSHPLPCRPLTNDYRKPRTTPCDRDATTFWFDRRPRGTRRVALAARCAARVELRRDTVASPRSAVR